MGTIDSAIQIMGANGYSREYPVERMVIARQLVKSVQ